VRKIQEFGGGKQDAFVVKFAPEGDHVVFSTLLGGSADEMAEAVAIDAQGAVYVGGQTASNDFPIKGGIRAKVAGSNEGFLTKVCDPFLLPSQAALRFEYTLGQPAPDLQTIQLSTCLPIPFTVASTDGGDFALAMSPSMGVTNASLDVRVDPASLVVGEYKSTIRISAPDAVNDGLLIPIVLVVLPPPPAITVEGVDLVSPGMVLEIHGSNLGSNATVTFDGAEAQVVFASDDRLQVTVPDSVAGKTETIVEVQKQGRRSNAIKLAVKPQ
jgi:hypothetical protein